MSDGSDLLLCIKTASAPLFEENAKYVRGVKCENSKYTFRYVHSAMTVKKMPLG